MEFLKSMTGKSPDQTSESKSSSLLDNVKSWKWFGINVDATQSIDSSESENTTLDDEEPAEDMQLTEEKTNYQNQSKTYPDNFHLLRDIDYYVEKDKHKKHKLNIYVPNGVGNNELLPVIVHVHGGGWKRGDRDTEFYGAPFMGRAYANRGFVSVTVSYRLAWTASHPAQAIDVSRAIKWVVENIKGFHGDSSKLFLSGHSAGGHLVSLLGTSSSYLEEQGVDPSLIKGVVSISGIYSLHDALLESVEGQCQGKGAWMNAMFHMRYVHGNFGKDTSKWQSASPAYYVNDMINKLKVLNVEESKENSNKQDENKTNNNEMQNTEQKSTENQTSTQKEEKSLSDGAIMEQALGATPPLVVKASKKLPPFLLISAEWDMGLEFGAARFFAILQEAGIHVDHKTIPGTHHGSVTRCNETADFAMAFINEILSKM